MKNIINKNTLLGFLLGILISGVTVYAVTYEAKNVSFTPTNTKWKKEDGSSITNIEEALNSLYKIKNTSEVIETSSTNLSNSTTINTEKNDYIIVAAVNPIEVTNAEKLYNGVLTRTSNGIASVIGLYKSNGGSNTISITDGEARNFGYLVFK